MIPYPRKMYIGNFTYTIGEFCIYYQRIHRHAKAHPPITTLRLKIWNSRITPKVFPADKMWKLGGIFPFPSWAIGTNVLLRLHETKELSLFFQLCDLGSFYCKEQSYSLSLKVGLLWKYLRKLAKQSCGHTHLRKTAQPSLMVTW